MMIFLDTGLWKMYSNHARQRNNNRRILCNYSPVGFKRHDSLKNPVFRLVIFVVQIQFLYFCFLAIYIYVSTGWTKNIIFFSNHCNPNSVCTRAIMFEKKLSVLHSLYGWPFFFWTTNCIPVLVRKTEDKWKYHWSNCFNWRMKVFTENLARFWLPPANASANGLSLAR